MTGDRMIARFCKGRGWTYNIGHRVDVFPKAARDTLVHVYGLRPSEAGEKTQHARAGAVVLLPKALVPA